MRRFLLPLADAKYTPSPSASGSGSLDMLVIKVTPLTQQSNIFIQHYYPLSQFLENTLGSDRINHLPKMPCCAYRLLTKTP